MTLGTSTPARIDFDLEIERLTEDDEPDYEEAPWYCVRTDSFPCPAQGCDFVAFFMTAAHLIIVWPAKDDPSLLWNAELARRSGRNPRPEQWRQELGNCIAYDLWDKIGRPIHGRIERPDGFDPHGPAWGR